MVLTHGHAGSAPMTLASDSTGFVEQNNTTRRGRASFSLDLARVPALKGSELFCAGINRMFPQASAALMDQMNQYSASTSASASRSGISRGAWFRAAGQGDPPARSSNCRSGPAKMPPQQKSNKAAASSAEGVAASPAGPARLRASSNRAQSLSSSAMSNQRCPPLPDLLHDDSNFSRGGKGPQASAALMDQMEYSVEALIDDTSVWDPTSDVRNEAFGSEEIPSYGVTDQAAFEWEKWRRSHTAYWYHYGIRAYLKLPRHRTLDHSELLDKGPHGSMVKTVYDHVHAQIRKHLQEKTNWGFEEPNVFPNEDSGLPVWRDEEGEEWPLASLHGTYQKWGSPIPRLPRSPEGRPSRLLFGVGLYTGGMNAEYMYHTTLGGAATRDANVQFLQSMVTLEGHEWEQLLRHSRVHVIVVGSPEVCFRRAPGEEPLVEKKNGFFVWRDPNACKLRVLQTYRMPWRIDERVDYPMANAMKPGAMVDQQGQQWATLRLRVDGQLWAGKVNLHKPLAEARVTPTNIKQESLPEEETTKSRLLPDDSFLGTERCLDTSTIKETSLWQVLEKNKPHCTALQALLNYDLHLGKITIPLEEENLTKQPTTHLLGLDRMVPFDEHVASLKLLDMVVLLELELVEGTATSVTNQFTLPSTITREALEE